MSGTYNYIDMMLKLKEEFFFGDNSGIYSLACAVACICAAFALIAWYNHMMNDPWGMFDLKGIIHILLPMVLVCNFSTFVLGPLDGMTSLVCNGLTASVKQDQGSLQAKLNNAYSSVENAIKGYTMRGQFETMVESGSSSTSLDNGASGNSNSVFESNVETNIDAGEKPGFFKRVWGSIKGAVQEAMGFPYKAISTVLSWAMSCIVDCARFVLQILSGVYLIVLGLIGPFVCAFSIIPAFRGNIMTWLSRYIQISFWTPMCSLIDFINFKLKDNLLDVFAGNGAVEQMVFPTVFLIFLDIATLSMIFSVPTLSSWVISGGGASGMAGQTVTAAKKAARLFGKGK